MFILKNLNIEVKQSKLMLNCESSEAKRTCSIVEKIISKRSEHVYIENLNIEAKRSKLMLNCESSEAKPIGSIVEKIISKRSEHVLY
jgi:hypothetical protein